VILLSLIASAITPDTAWYSLRTGKRQRPGSLTAQNTLDAEGVDPADRIETWRNSKLSMSGIVGQLAEWTVQENDHGNSTFELRRYKPFPSCAVRPRTAGRFSRRALEALENDKPHREHLRDRAAQDHPIEGMPLEQDREAAFRTAMAAAVQFLDNLITNSITVNIEVGYGEDNGQQLGG
jgi:hypothetical protein